jgi:hypothetical protein
MKLIRDEGVLYLDQDGTRFPLPAGVDVAISTHTEPMVEYRDRFGRVVGVRDVVEVTLTMHLRREDVIIGR